MMNPVCVFGYVFGLERVTGKCKMSGLPVQWEKQECFMAG